MGKKNKYNKYHQQKRKEKKNSAICNTSRSPEYVVYPPYKIMHLSKQFKKLF